jgi:hypothetical protein
MTEERRAKDMPIAALIAAPRDARVQALFGERQGIRDAAEPAVDTTAASGSCSVARLMSDGPTGVGGLGSHAVAPIAAARLYRELRAAGSIAASRAARAASTAGPLRRDLDGITVEFVIEADAAYAVIPLPGEQRPDRVPRVLELLGEDGTLIRVELPAPNDGVIQVAVPRTISEHSDPVRLMREAGTSIFLV